MTVPNRASSRPRAARSLVAFPLAAAAAVVWTHALANPLRAATGGSLEQLAAVASPLTLAALVIAAVAPIRAASVGRAALRGAALGGVATSLMALFASAIWPVGLSLVVAGGASAALAVSARRWLPPSVEELSHSRRWVTVGWLVLATLALLQIGRLSTHMSDPESDWFVSTRHPFVVEHECLNAYLYAAELNERGEPNVYDSSLYPGLNPDAKPRTEIAHMAPEDPFQYPPPFLILPRLAIALSHDYAALRAAWFGLNFTLCIGSVLALARWVGGRVGGWAALAAPPILLSFPVLYNLQYGQFHFAAIALAVLGAMALESRRRALGSALLSMAVLAKVFPAVLLVAMLGRRRFRDVGATLVAMAAISLAALPLVGFDAFSAFFGYQVPRLGSGSAFAFGEAWPDYADMITAANQGAFGVAEKLQWLGLLPEGKGTPRLLSGAFSLAVLVVAFWRGRMGDEGRARQAVGALGLLGLASLTSTGAWADYVPLCGVWLSTYLVPMARGSRAWAVALTVVFVLQATLLGTVPLGGAADPAWMLPMSLLSAIALASIFVVGVLAGRAQISFDPASHRRAVPASAG